MVKRDIILITYHFTWSFIVNYFKASASLTCCMSLQMAAAVTMAWLMSSTRRASSISRPPPTSSPESVHHGSTTTTRPAHVATPSNTWASMLIPGKFSHLLTCVSMYWGLHMYVHYSPPHYNTKEPYTVLL